MPPLIFARGGVKTYEIWLRFSTAVAFEALWFRIGTAYRKSKRCIGSAHDWAKYCFPSQRKWDDYSPLPEKNGR